MDLGNGWNLTAAQWRQLHLLEWLYDRCDGNPGQVVRISYPELACALPGVGVASGQLLRGTFDYLYREGLVRYPIPYLGEVTDVPAQAELTEAGASFVRYLRVRRADPAERRPAVRGAVLRWLYEQTAAGTPSPALWNFSEGRYARYLSATGFFTIAEVKDAAEWLYQHGYISGTTESPRITADGERAVEEGWQAVREVAARAGMTINVTGSSGVNIANLSPGAAQAAVGAVSSEARQLLRNLADYLDQTAPQLGLTPEKASSVPDLVDNLREAADGPGADRKRLARVLEAVQLLAVGAASVPLGAGLQALAVQIAHALGL